jgi:hypothetical protein
MSVACSPGQFLSDTLTAHLVPILLVSFLSHCMPGFARETYNIYETLKRLKLK